MVALHAPAAGGAKAGAKNSFVFGEKSIHFDLLEVHAGGKVYPLTLMEASILRFLIDHEGKAVSRKSMLQEVWGLREDTDTRAIDNFIVRLRRYVEDDPARPVTCLLCAASDTGSWLLPAPEAALLPASP